MRTAQPIVVNGETRRKLEQQARGRSTPARLPKKLKRHAYHHRGHQPVITAAG
jgi:hypothetical protein